MGSLQTLNTSLFFEITNVSNSISKNQADETQYNHNYCQKPKPQSLEHLWAINNMNDVYSGILPLIFLPCFHHRRRQAAKTNNTMADIIVAIFQIGWCPPAHQETSGTGINIMFYRW
jgi:hypothetical protein